MSATSCADQFVQTYSLTHHRDIRIIRHATPSALAHRIIPRTSTAFMHRSLTMIAVADFAKRIAKRISGDIQGITIDEIELDERSNEWIVTIGFWLPSPLPRRGSAIVAPMPICREARVLRIGAKSPARLVAMKVKPSPAN